MKFLSNPLSPLAPYAAAIKIGLGVLVLSALIGFLWSWNARGNEIEAQAATLDSIAAAATVATVQPDENGHRVPLKPQDVPAAIAALSSSLQSADATLRAISARTMTARAASEAADRVLDRDLDDMRRRSAGRDLEEWDPFATPKPGD